MKTPTGIQALRAYARYEEETKAAGKETDIESFVQTIGFTTVDDFLTSCAVAVAEGKAFTEDCIKTFHRDLQQFCSVAYAPVKKTYMKGFNLQPQSLLALDEAQEHWVEAYRRLQETEHGMMVIVQTRYIVCNWFAKWGNPEVADFDTRLNELFSEWDSWEIEAGGVNAQSKTANEIIDDYVANASVYQDRFGRVLAMVMATDSYLEDNKGDDEALKQWPVVQEYYDNDVAYVSKELKYLGDKDKVPAMFDAVMETFIPLINHSQRFRSISGMWAVSRLQELFEMD